MAKVKAIPEGMHSLTVQIVVKDCAGAIAFWQKAFGAEEIHRAPDPSGKKIWHAMLRIGDSMMFTNDEQPEMGSLARPVTMWIYGENVDAAFKRAVDAGCKATMPPADMFWGDRFAGVQDPYGNNWQLATHTKDMTPEEMKKAQDAFVASMPKK
jgi:uncharacterized glyoxalase superfamily protein PhnB